MPGFCKSATLEEVRQHGHVLTPGRYVGVEAQEDDDEPFEEKMQRLAAQLREMQGEAACLRRHACAGTSAGRCFGKQAKLDAAIAANLKELGYGG